MKLKDVILLLPCHRLEDLSLDYGPEEADGLLGVWSAPFHPAILASIGCTPRWVSASNPPEGDALADSLVLVPNVSLSMIPENWWAATQAAGAVVIDGLSDRDAMIAGILPRLDPEPDFLGPDDINPDLAADLLALGFCHLQAELTTRRLRYMSSLDEGRLRSEAVRAAAAIMRGDEATGRESLQRAFDALTEAREYFYPTEAALLDLTLVAPTTLGEPLRRELVPEAATNLLISGNTLAKMAQRDPETLAAARTALESDKASIVGGEWGEPALPLLVPESILAELRRGLASYQDHLGRRPGIFGRRRFGLYPLLPGILAGLGFRGACHFTLDAGRFPTGNQSKARWEGLDDVSLESLARVPLDASRHDTFLKLPERLGKSLDLDQSATVVFAHWPGKSSRWYHDLRRTARYSPVLGRFVTIDKYFENTLGSGQVARHEADAYRSPYLDEAVAASERDPISRWTRYHRRRVHFDALEALDFLGVMVAGRSESPCDMAELSRRIDELVAGSDPDATNVDECLAAGIDKALRRIAEALPRQDQPAAPGQLLVNPNSSTRTFQVRPVGEDSVAERDELLRTEVPAMGFAWVGSGAFAPSQTSPKTRKPFWSRKSPPARPPLAERTEQGAYAIRNEFFEATIDPTTGAIRAIHDHKTRGNRLAQQIALRMPGEGPLAQNAWGEEDHEREYSIMAADEVKILEAGPALGRIASRGRLVDREGKRLAGFAQTTTARRGSRVLDLEIEIEPDREPDARPWTSYYAARFAWNDASAELRRGLGMTSVKTDAARLESPHFIDIRGAKVRTTILAGGLPFHRLFDQRKLDTLLIVHGESARRFRLGVGFDLLCALPAAIELLAPTTVLPDVLPPQSPRGWLFHVNARNVAATHWEPLVVDGRVEGFRARLLETEGRAATVRLRSFRQLISAEQTDLIGQTVQTLAVEDDCVTIDLTANQWAQIEARWKT
jgi:alpha-mannosidase